MKKFWKIATPILASVLVVCIIITSVTLFSKKENVEAVPTPSFSRIPEIVQNNSKDHAFEMWELVPSKNPEDMAELAFMYDEKQIEPWEEKLKSKTADEREAYMKELQEKWLGLYNCPNETSRPSQALMWADAEEKSYDNDKIYEECYALKEGETEGAAESGWKPLELASATPEVLEVGATGYELKPVEIGQGDYRLDAKYEPAIKYVSSNTMEKYKQVVDYYVYSEKADQYYGVIFQKAELQEGNGSVSAYGKQLYLPSKSWYIHDENDYDAIKAAAPNAYIYCISKENIYGAYEFKDVISSESLTYDKIKEDKDHFYYSVVFSRVNEGAELSAGENYYEIMDDGVQFFVDKYGNGVGEYAANDGAQYIKAETEAEGHFVRTDAKCYNYVGAGNGTHCLVQKADGVIEEFPVHIGKIYYRGGFICNRLLEKEVFHVDGDTSMNFTVTTMNPKKLDDLVASDGVPDLLYISARSLVKEKADGFAEDKRETFSKDNDISWETARKILMLAKDPNVRLPIIVDRSIINTADVSKYGDAKAYTNLQRLVALLCSDQIFKTEKTLITQEVLEDTFGMKEFYNWRSGNYNYGTGAYGDHKKRLCMKTSKSTSAGRKYTAHISVSDPKVHILVRTMSGSGVMKKSYDLLDGGSFTVAQGEASLRIGLYVSGENEKTDLSYDTYKQWFKDGQTFYLTETLYEEHDVVPIDKTTDISAIDWKTLTYNNIYSPTYGSVNNNIYVYPGHDSSDSSNKSKTPFLYESFATGMIAQGMGDISNSETQKSFVQNAKTAGFGEIAEYIVNENLSREIENKNGTGTYKLFPLEITKAIAVEYIINFLDKEEKVWNDTFRILDIEPGRTSDNTPTIDGAVIQNVFKENGFVVDAVEVTYMTSAEFIGKIEDLSRYDMVYLGFDDSIYNEDTNTDTNNKTKKYFNVENGKIVYNDRSMDGLIYSNIGDITAFYSEGSGTLGYAGLLDSDYEWESVTDVSGNQITARKELHKATISGDDIQYYDPTMLPIRSVWKDDVEIENPYYTQADHTYRYSGNDITREKENDLKNYVEAGYPLLVHQDFYTVSGNNQKEQVNEDTIDNCSNIYDFLKDVKDKPNVMTYKAGKADTETIIKYASLGKAKIHIMDHPLADYNNGAGKTFFDVENDTITLDFKVTNQGAANTDAKFRMAFYLDINADGKFSETQEEVAALDMVVTKNGKVLKAQRDTDENGNIVWYYEIEPGTRNSYHISYELGSEVIGLIPWKLSVQQSDNKYRANSEQGYYYNKNLEQKPTLHILQINTVSGNSHENNFNMQALMEKGKQKEAEGALNEVPDFYTLTKDLEDFKLDIVTIPSDEYAKEYGKNKDNYFDTCVSGNAADMLVIGFGDMYKITNTNDCMYGILNFINSGKPVLFTHDTTSFYNDTVTKKGWGYDFNVMVRNIVGMDRYGVLVNEEIKKGLPIDKSTEEVAYNAAVAFAEQKETDLAYVPKSNRTKLAKQCQGFCYGALQHYVKNFGYDDGTVTKYWAYPKERMKSGNSYQYLTTMVEQVNQGQITTYPYAVDQSFSVAQTHYQYYQLDLNEDEDNDGKSDIVVWYTLAGKDVSVYNCSPKDVRNNYYIYTKGNVTYSGVGHSALAERPADQNELKLYINTLVAAYNAGKKAPTISIYDDASENANEIKVMYAGFDDTLTQDGAVTGNNAVSGNASIEAQLSAGQKSENVLYLTVRDKNFVRNLKSKVAELQFGIQISENEYDLLTLEEKANCQVYEEDETKVYLSLFEPTIRDLEGKEVSVEGIGETYEVEIPSSILGKRTYGTIYVRARTKITRKNIHYDEKGQIVESEKEIEPEYSPYSQVTFRLQRVGLMDLD